MNILALDLSSKSTGWAVSKDGVYYTSGCITTTSTDYIKRILRITKEVTELVKKFDINQIECEEVRFGDKNIHTFKVLMYLQALIVVEAYKVNNSIIFNFQQPSEWRKKVGIQTGRNSLRESLKEADILYVKTNYGIEVNDDEADAIGILDSVLKKPATEIKYKTAKPKPEILEFK